ncbi:MAG: molybdopterin-dependent oxidoreductase [Chloroflexi bacterium]|nr:molybdopterin-dependent oxidoreductase [Chloroflexota bacterium]
MTNYSTKKVNDDQVIVTTCKSHCGGVCPLKVHVQNGKIIKIESDTNIRACARGRAYRQRVYSPDRLKYPMRLIGKKGSGNFKRISWDEALDTISYEIKRVRKQYGSSGILYFASAGDLHHLHKASLIENLLGKTGGYSGCYARPSCEGAEFADKMTYGPVSQPMGGCYTRDNWVKSKFIIMWGYNPLVSSYKGNPGFFIKKAKESGTRVVFIDPRYTDSAATFADLWVPIKPGTDTAMLVAMAYVIISENLHNKSFLDKYTLGFDKYKEYIFGIEDTIIKTPLWAEKITGVPSDIIIKLAREYAIKKPAALLDGLGPGRTAYGEQFHRAAIALAAMTGNIGVQGGSAPGNSLSAMGPIKLGLPIYARIKGCQNPVDIASQPRKHAGPYKGSSSLASSARINEMDLVNAVIEGKKGGYPADYKLLYIVNCNYLNQFGNINKIIHALNKFEFIVIHEQFLTPTAKFADIVLPVNTFMERNDLAEGSINLFCGYVNKVIDPLGESKSPFEIANELATKLGISNFAEKNVEEWLREVVAGCKDIPDYEEFKKQGLQKINTSSGLVAYEDQIKDPVNHPFGTPSGKIEIYSQEIANINNSSLPPVPKYIETWESPNDPLINKYPLQLITTHPQRRAHSQFDNLPWLKELYTHSVTINTIDAQNRGIKDCDLVKVFNDRGAMIIPANVTERIMPGVVDVPEGARYNPDKNGFDMGGCANVLTMDGSSPGGAFPCNTCLVQIIKIKDQLK